MLNKLSKKQTKDYKNKRQDKKKEEEKAMEDEKRAAAKAKQLQMIKYEGRVQMRRTKPKQLRKKKTPPKRDEEEEMKLKYLGDLEKLHAEFMAAKQQH